MTATSELARFIRERADEILLAWEREVAPLPDARGLAWASLRDDLRRVLDVVADLVGSPADEWPPDPSRQGAIDAHVLARIEVGSGMPLVVAELAALRRVVQREWRATPAGAGDVEGPQRLDAAVDAVLLDASRQFVEVRRRLFDALEELVLAAGGRDLTELLQELLRIARREVQTIDTAAVFVRVGDELRVRAAVGLEEELREHFTVRVGEGFAGLVAAEQRAVLLHDAANDPLITRPALRDAGIRALYGVPLIARSADGAALIGVAHMGSRRADDFPEEARTVFRMVASAAAVLVHEALLRERLAQERARFQAIADTSPAIIYLKDTAGRYEFMSRRAIEVAGYSPEAFVGHTDREVWPREVADRIEAVDRRVLETRQSVAIEEMVPTPDGKFRIYMTSKFPVLDSLGRVTGIAGVSTDITDRKRREEAQALLARAGALLARSLELEGALATLVELVLPALADCCVLDLVEDDGSVQRRVAHADPARAELVRAYQALPIDRSRPHLAQAVFQTRRSVFMGELPAEYLDTIAQSPEHRRLLEELGPRALLQVPFMARGRLLGAMVLVSTSERRFGRDDLTLAEDLARLASLTIDNVRLYAAAQRAVRARDEVLAIVAHDLRSPLNTVVSAITGVLGGGDVAEATRRHLELALSAARRAGRLTSDLLRAGR